MTPSSFVTCFYLAVDLRACARSLIKNSVSKSTQKNYLRAVDKLTEFCRQLNISKRKKFQLSTLEQWIASLYRDKLAHTTILGHLSAVKHHCMVNQIPHELDSKRIRALMAGIKRSQPLPKVKKSISLRQLTKLVQRSKDVLPREERLMFNAAVTLAFYGFLRPSKYTLSKAGHHLLRKHVTIRKRSILITLDSYKHARSCAEIAVHPTDDETCPCYHLQKYLRCCPASSNEPLFDKSHADFRSLFHTVCNHIRLADVTPHSLRHGGATWAGLQGWSDARIQAHGRWRSDAYKIYVKAR